MEKSTMTSIELIKNALAMGDRGMMMLLEDLRDAPMTSPTPRGGNHPLWVLGHITFVEASTPKVLFGEPHPLAHWAPLFAAGAEPTSDPKAYPSFDEVLKAYREARTKNLKLLDEIGEAGLDRPTKFQPKGLEQVLGTAGQAFMTIAMHQMNHRGQLADCRRALGRKPIFTPGM
jgi:DinB superfamily